MFLIKFYPHHVWAFIVGGSEGRRQFSPPLNSSLWLSGCTEIERCCIGLLFYLSRLHIKAKRLQITARNVSIWSFLILLRYCLYNSSIAIWIAFIAASVITNSPFSVPTIFPSALSMVQRKWSRNLTGFFSTSLYARISA